MVFLCGVLGVEIGQAVRIIDRQVVVGLHDKKRFHSPDLAAESIRYEPKQSIRDAIDHQALVNGKLHVAS